MNYEPNKIQWKRGDVVLLDPDGKNEQCLALVLTEENGIYRGVYPFLGRYGCRKPVDWVAPSEECHSPKRFAVKVPDTTMICMSVLELYQAGGTIRKIDASALEFVKDHLADVTHP